MIYKNKYHTEALACRDCAMHIVENLEKLEYIKEVFIDYDNKDITITSIKEISEKEINEVINYILEENHCEEHNYKHLHNVVTEEFNFEDIDCPNCAAKVERALNNEKDILDARVNFINKKIIIKHLNNIEVYDIITKVVNKIENGAKVYDSHHDKIECECETNRKKINVNSILKYGATILGITLFILGIILKHVFELDNALVISIFIVSYLLIGYDILIESIISIFHGDVFNENFLMIIASIGALAINEPIESIAVILLFKIGEHYQNVATEKSKKSIKSLMELKTNTVTLYNGEAKNIAEVNVGELIMVKVGERIPLDGIIKSGSTNVDMKALTGESRPVSIEEGGEILSGSVNLSKVIEIEVTKKDSESTISKVLKLVEEAGNQKSKTEEFITKFARIYTPCILIITMLLGIVEYFFIKRFTFPEILNNMFTVLVISCPCALVISIPLGYFAGIGRASSMGVLVKGGNYLEALTNVGTFVFDKTGTITKGNFKVTDVYPVEGKTKDEVLSIITSAEQYSSHPIAQSIKDAYVKNQNNKNLTELDDKKFDIEEISGLGLKVTTDNDIILVGNKNLMLTNNVKIIENKEIGTIIYLSVNNIFYGSVVIRDEIKETSKDIISYLNRNANTIMLTGDTDDVASYVKDEVGVMEYNAQLLPKQKYEILKEIIKKETKNVVYIGDGINDSPSLKLASVGIAMGDNGSDAAKECADIVIMNDDLMKVKSVIALSKYTKLIILQNIIFALIIKILALVVGVFGILGSWGMLAAVFADVGVCLLAILNTMRILKKRNL